MPALYRNGVGIFLLNKNKKLWVGKRIDSDGKFWQMPQGGIDTGEKEDDAMKRELKEEIGINNVNILMKSEDWFQYDLPQELMKSIWKGKYNGQRQKWYACEIVDDDNKINLNYHKPEFSEWKWIEPRSAIDLVIPFKKSMYEKILDTFRDLYY